MPCKGSPIFKKKRLLGILLVVACINTPTAALADDCNTDCGKAAKFRYPCPTPLNLGRKCTGKNPTRFATCELAKVASCKLWKEAADFFEPKLKPALQKKYNKKTYADADNKQDYIIDCTSAVTAALAVLGSAYGPPWGSLAGGAAGLFVGKRICIQSTKW